MAKKKAAAKTESPVEETPSGPFDYDDTTHLPPEEDATEDMPATEEAEEPETVDMPGSGDDDASPEADDQSKAVDLPEDLVERLTSNIVARLGVAKPGGDTGAQAAGNGQAEALSLDIDNDLFPELVEPINKLVGVVNAQANRIAQLEGQIGKTAQETRLDRMIGSSDKAIQKVLSDHTNRQRLTEHMDALRAGYKAIGQEVPSDDVMFDQATSALFKEQTTTARQSATQQKIRDRKGQFTARASAREWSMTGVDEAKANMRQILERAKEG